MKRVLISGIALSAVISMSAMAERNVTYEYGTVVETTPIVKNIRVSTPREECWDEEVRYRSRGDDGLSTILGAVIGGAIGNAVGHKKKNKQVGAVVGAVVGGSIGSSMAKKNGRTVRSQTEEVCKVITEHHEEERIVGYRVRYRYNDETYTTRTDVDPGESIRLEVAVSPVF